MLVISETCLRQDYIKRNGSGLQRAERGGGGEMGEGVGGGKELDEVSEAPRCRLRPP